VSDRVAAGEPLAIIYGKDKKTIMEQKEEIANAFLIDSGSFKKTPLLLGIVNEKGTKLFN